MQKFAVREAIPDLAWSSGRQRAMAPDRFPAGGSCIATSQRSARCRYPVASRLRPLTLPHVDIRAEEATDEEGVHRLHLQAFGDHGVAVVDLVRGLRPHLRSDNGLSLVAVDADGIVGHVLFSRSLLDAPQRQVEVQVLSPSPLSLSDEARASARR